MNSIFKGLLVCIMLRQISPRKIVAIFSYRWSKNVCTMFREIFPRQVAAFSVTGDLSLCTMQRQIFARKMIAFSAIVNLKLKWNTILKIGFPTLKTPAKSLSNMVPRVRCHSKKDNLINLKQIMSMTSILIF